MNLQFLRNKSIPLLNGVNLPLDLINPGLNHNLLLFGEAGPAVILVVADRFQLLFEVGPWTWLHRLQRLQEGALSVLR